MDHASRSTSARRGAGSGHRRRRVSSESLAAAKSVDLDALNNRLREIGVGASELLVESEGDGFHLTGTIPDAHARAGEDQDDLVAGPEGHVPEPWLISYTIFDVEGLYERLDEFAPGWR